jgi:nucleolar pre-ribosomal-associated protein 1
MSLLFSSSAYNTLASPVSSPALAIRSPFIHLLSAMFTSNPYMTCQPNFIEQLLPLYKGSLSLSDQRILSLFQLFESYRHISVASVLSAWSSGLGRSSRPFEALTSLEPTRMLATAIAFPLRRSLCGVQPVEENDEGQGLYDPCFVLALFGATLSTDLTGLDWVEILRTNVLGVAVMALSSRDAEMRTLGGFVLTRTVKYLEVGSSRFARTHADNQSVAFQEKPQLAYILRLLRYSIPAPTSDTQPRLPVLISTFLAHVLRTLASPSNPLYPAASRFLLQRHKFDAGDVPMLFGMLYASGEGHKRDRNWIVRFIRDASRSEAVSVVLLLQRVVILIPRIGVCLNDERPLSFCRRCIPRRSMLRSVDWSSR